MRSRNGVVQYSSSGALKVAQTSPPSSTALAFTSGDNYLRSTITDANVTATSKIRVFSVRRTDVTEVSDHGWYYLANIVTQAAGTFDVVLIAFDWGSEPTDGVPPNETITLIYDVSN